MNVTEFADAIGLTRGHVSSVISGSLRSRKSQQVISDFLKITI